MMIGQKESDIIFKRENAAKKSVSLALHEHNKEVKSKIGRNGKK